MSLFLSFLSKILFDYFFLFLYYHYNEFNFMMSSFMASSTNAEFMMFCSFRMK